MVRHSPDFPCMSAMVGGVEGRDIFAAGLLHTAMHGKLPHTGKEENIRETVADAVILDVVS